MIYNSSIYLSGIGIMYFSNHLVIREVALINKTIYGGYRHFAVNNIWNVFWSSKPIWN